MEEQNQQKPPTPVPATDLPETTETPKNSIQNPSPLPPIPPNHTSKKRKPVDNVDTNKHFKIRAIVKDLRPNFIQVLRTPDFRNSKAAEEIKRKMSLLIDLYKQLVPETVSNTSCNSRVQSLPGVGKVEHIPSEKLPRAKHGPQPQHDQIPQKASEPALVGNKSNNEVQRVAFEGSYIVGGSNLGWNFIMHPGGKSVYYGATKESRKIAKEPCLNG